MPRPHSSPRYFHIVGALLTPETRLRHSGHYRLLLRTVDRYLEAPHVQLIAFCLLPNAWHLVIGARGTRHLDGLVSRVRDTHLRAARAERHPMPVAITPLSTGGALIGRCVMVERLPVATGLVTQVQDWPWGSAAERFRLRTRVPLLSPRVLLSQAWFDHLNAPRRGDVSRMTVSPDDLAEMPGLLAARPHVGDHPVGVAGRAHENHAHAHVEGAEHLGIGHAAGGLQPRENRRYGPTAAIK